MADTNDLKSFAERRVSSTLTRGMEVKLKTYMHDDKDEVLYLNALSKFYFPVKKNAIICLVKNSSYIYFNEFLLRDIGLSVKHKFIFFEVLQCV